jgi:hypothetical protein
VRTTLAAAGIAVPMSDLFGVGGQHLLAATPLSAPSRARVDSAMRVISALDFEIELFTELVAGRLRTDPGYQTVQAIPGVGPVLGAVFVAEIGDITRFARPAQLASWAGLTPNTTSPTPPSTVAGSPNRAPGWSAPVGSSAPPPAERSCTSTPPGRGPPRSPPPTPDSTRSRRPDPTTRPTTEDRSTGTPAEPGTTRANLSPAREEDQQEPKITVRPLRKIEASCVNGIAIAC